MNRITVINASQQIQVIPNDEQRVIVLQEQARTVVLQSIGVQGIRGHGVAQGGAVGDVLVKKSTADYDTEWTDSPTFDKFSLDTTAVETTGVGQFTWNDEDGTANLGLKGGNAVLQIGQEEVVRVLNRTGGTITDMHAVRVIGAQGNRLEVALAQATNDNLSAATLAIVTESIANNQQGFATRGGLVRNVNTSAFAEGAPLFLSPTVLGGITSTEPVAPYHAVRLGWCVRSHATVGSIYVHVQNGYEIRELHDVLQTNVLDRDTLVYDSATSIYKNSPIRASAVVPLSSSSTGKAGTIAHDDNYLYICIANNSWKRISLSSF